jgi:hypothetical protein
LVTAECVEPTDLRQVRGERDPIKATLLLVELAPEVVQLAIGNATKEAFPATSLESRKPLVGIGENDLENCVFDLWEFR